MVTWPTKSKVSPIGIDIGSRAVKLVQFDIEGKKLVDAARWDLSTDESGNESRAERLTDALRRAREGRAFRGREAVLCLSAPELFIQNIRVAKGSGGDLQRQIFQEAAGRIPFALDQAEVRYLEAADVRQGDSVRREVIVFAVHQPVLEEEIKIATAAGFRPIAVDTEPTAILRCYVQQFRRDDDQNQRVMFVHVGSMRTAVVIAQGSDVLFIKYIDVGGRHFDEAVAGNLKMDFLDASALRRHNGDRRSDKQDPEVMRSIGEATRPVLDQLASELGLCIRYHSVTFRGRPLVQMVLGGGESSAALQDALSSRLDLKCELGDPMRNYDASLPSGHVGQWDVATGLALRERN